MIKERIIRKLTELTGHTHIEILNRGNAAITAALKLAKNKILIPEEGGWLSYRRFPTILEVKTNDAVIDLEDLKDKSKEGDLFIYQNPGGYFAEQPMKEIYQICKHNDCLVVLDVSGSIGTKLGTGEYADILVGSFGKWKLVDALVGGFISCKEKELFIQLETNDVLSDPESLKKIKIGLNNLDQRIKFLLERREKVIADLKNHNVLHKDHLGFVVVVEYQNLKEKEKLINYCVNNQLEYTECPRYIRINKNAISIEIKR